MPPDRNPHPPFPDAYQPWLKPNTHFLSPQSPPPPPPMALDTHVMGTTEDLEAHTDELSLVDDLGSIWLSLGLVEMSDSDSDGGGGSPRDMATGLLPLHAMWAQSSDIDSVDSKPQGWLTDSESGFNTDVSETNTGRRVNPPPPLEEWRQPNVAHATNPRASLGCNP